MPKDDPYTKFRQPPTPAVGQPIAVLPDDLDPGVFDSSTVPPPEPAAETPPVPVTGGHAPPGWVPPPEMTLPPPPSPEPTTAVLVGSGSMPGRVYRDGADPLQVKALELLERGLAGGCSFVNNYQFRLSALSLCGELRKSVVGG